MSSNIISVDGRYYHSGCVEAEPGEKLEMVPLSTLDKDDICKGCNDPLLAPDYDPDDDDEDDDDEEDMKP